MDAPDLQRVVDACNSRLRHRASWTTPGGYPDSLALAVLGAIWAMIARYEITRGVVSRYAASRHGQGANAYVDGITDLLAEYERWGGNRRVHRPDRYA